MDLEELVWKDIDSIYEKHNQEIEKEEMDLESIQEAEIDPFESVDEIKSIKGKLEKIQEIQEQLELEEYDYVSKESKKERAVDTEDEYDYDPIDFDDLWPDL